MLVRPDDAYLVDVRAHGCWSQQNLIEIIHVNRPIVLAPFRINIEPSDSPVTSEQRANLRRRRMNAAIEMPDGTVYAGIGGGYVRSGANLDAVRWADITLRMAEEIEKSMTGIEPQLTAELTRTTGGVPDPIRLRLVDLGEERAAIVIENANSALPVRFEVPITGRWSSSMASCPSWLHDEAVPILAGRRTCAAHVDEEPHIIRIEEELERVAAQVRAYESASEKHPDEAKAFLESAIRWFFDQELKPAGYRAIQGFRQDTELDIIATVDAGEREDWNIHFEVRRHVERAHVVLHLEVAYRASRDYRKVRDSILKLNESIDQNIAQGRGLPWTALVLLGPGWTDSDAAVMQVVHTAYHGRSTQRLDHAGASWWPFVDAVVMPGVLYKKHDAFEAVEMVGHRRPIMMPAPCAPDPLRPLALARGFVIHRLRVLSGSATPEGEAWPDHLTAAIFGCVSQIAASRALDSLRTVLMDCHHGDARALYHMASAYPRAMCYPMPLEFEDKTCVSGGRYSMRIRTPIWNAGRPTSEVGPLAASSGAAVADLGSNSAAAADRESPRGCGSNTVTSSED